jgi:CubicO group peptidase (beta-lactamase class C family)
VTPKTLFLAGSISKPVTAIGALALVDQGKLSLNGAINTALKTWKIPESEDTAQHEVTLAQILDHTSGITGGDFFPGYAVAQPVPTLVEILDGRPPTITAPVRVNAIPGARWSYSGNGYLVIQQAMIDATGKPFPALMRELVFDPLGLSDTTFEQPLPADRAARAAAGTLLNGNPVAGKWRIQPEMAAGGLWTTVTDLATLAIDVALTVRGQSHHVLSQATASEMIAPHWSEDVINILGTTNFPDRMGYGFFVGDDHRFGHIGGNVGYQATLVMFADSGRGAVIMTNSDVGLQAGNALLNKIAAVYGWHYTAPAPP